MIIASEKQNVSVSSEFKTSGFKIQASAKAFDILSSNIYTHKIRAVIREISCNAYDSHIAAKQNKPFKVHLPTSIEPFFCVRDFGTGLNDCDIREVFTTYFYSTKTSSNDFVGALGLGSKSPFCLVDSFLVTSWKNGVKNIYSCYKNQDNEPEIALLSSEESCEPTGLEVNLSVEEHQIGAFTSEAVEVYKFFSDLPNINIESVIKSIENSKNKFNIKTEDYWIQCEEETKNNEYKAVMGNVAYDLEVDYEFKKMCSSAYIYFDIGDLNFNPGRESLSLDDKTRAKIQEKLQLVSNDLISHCIEKLKKENNLFKKCLLAKTMRFVKGITKEKTWQEAINYVDSIDERYVLFYKPFAGWAVQESIVLHPYNNCEYYIINTPQDISKIRVKAYVRNTGKQVALISKKLADSLCVPDEMIFDKNNIPKIKRTKNASKVVFNNIESISRKGKFIAKNIPTTEKIYIELHRNSIAHNPYWMNQEYKLKDFLEILEKLNLIPKDTEIFLLNITFMKTKHFKNDKTWIKFEDFVKKTIDGFTFEVYDNVDMSKISMIKEIYKYTKNTKLNFIKSANLFINSKLLPNFAKTIDTPIVKMIDDIYKKYPMFKFIEYYQVENNINDIVSYMNTVDQVN